MNIYGNITEFNAKNPVVTIGTFDGVHLGHRQIIHRLKQKAKEIGGTPLIITFWPHPKIILQQNNTPVLLLNTLEEKKQLFKNVGINNIIVCSFTKEFSSLSSLDFIKQYLVDKIGVKAIIFGYDHHFGKNRDGNFETLAKNAKKWNFEIEKVEEYKEGLTNISSTTIRKYLLNGKIKEANKLLGYNYSLTGLVFRGLKLGRKLGFPTANIVLNDENKLIPKQGVYAIKVFIENKTYNGVLNIGNKPTIEENQSALTIEAHILDFNKDIYSNKIQIEFIDYIRAEKKFDSLKKLSSQIEKDIIKSKLILNNDSK